MKGSIDTCHQASHANHFITASNTTVDYSQHLSIYKTTNIAFNKFYVYQPAHYIFSFPVETNGAVDNRDSELALKSPNAERFDCEEVS